MIVEEVMSADPYAATTKTTVREVLRMLAEADVRHLPIVENHTLVGIVSDRDLRGAIPTALDEFERPQAVERALSQPISKIMNTDILSVYAESDLVDAIDLMIEHKVGAIPVVEPDSSKLIGIVSYVDALRAARDVL